MNNGQINAVPLQPVMPPPQDTASAAVVSKDNGQQNGGSFAEMLGEIQRTKVLPDSGQTEQSLEPVAENLVVDLQAGLPELSLLASTSEPVSAKQDDVEKAEAGNNDAPLRNDLDDLATQMFMSAYLQPGRMPAVNNQPELPVDVLQKVAVAQEQTVAIFAAAIEKQTGQESVKPGRMSDVDNLTVLPAETQLKVAAASVKTEIIPALSSATQVVGSDRMSDASNMAILPAETQLKVAAASVKTEIIPALSSATQMVGSDRMSDASNMTALTAGTPQKDATVSIKPELLSVLQEKIKVEPIVVEPLKTTVVPSPTASAGPIVLKDVNVDNQHAALGKNVTATLISSLPVPSPESELEIQMSQPQPITARLVTSAVSADSRSITVVPGPVVTPEQLMEKVRSGNALDSVKEVTSTLQAIDSANESILGSGTSPGGEGDQGQPDSASDHQMLTQNMRAQSGAEHQKVSALSTKAVYSETVRQDMPEQVMHQVKERLVQHDIKSGSQQITLTLSPDSLGELKMNLNLQGQKLSVEIVTENRTVRDIIVQHTEALKESLARQNITMESFDVTTGGKGSGNQGQNQNAWRELAKQQQQSWITQSGYQVARADLPSSQIGYQKQQGQSMLDIHY
jgi:flagellar hook-length control protein FliK